MRTILHTCCGMDVHKDSIVACILKTVNISDEDQKKEEVDKDIRVFDTFPNDLKKLKNWLESENCQHVAMESTGVYWHPIYDVLEGAFDGNIEILVVNARHMKNVRGKKTDIKDAEWIADLLRHGLLSGSFVPPREVRELRQLTRYRKTIVQNISTQKNRIEKTLQMAGFKLSTILSDVFGVSGRNLINVLIKKGYLSPSDVESETKCLSDEKKANLKSAINGKLGIEQRSFLSLQINHLDSLLDHLQSIEESIEQCIVKSSINFSPAIALLDSIPGIGITAAIAIIAEIGTDMSKFPSADNLASWSGLTPGCNESAGKKKNTRILHGNPYIKGIICECAWSIVRKRNTYLANFYWKLKVKRGSKKSIIALARKILVIIYNLLKNNEVYNEDRFEIVRKQQEAKQIKKLFSDAVKYGYTVAPLEQTS